MLADERVASRVHWGFKLNDIQLQDDGVKAVFADSEVQGRVLVGAEGSNSVTRRFLCPETYRNVPLDVKLLGAAVDMTPEQAAPLRNIDPLLFQGCHPDTNVFLWVSTLDTPVTNGTAGSGKEHYKMQLILSWPADERAVPETDTLRAEEMKRRAREIHPLLRCAVDRVSSAQEIAIQDWPCLPWDNRDGRVTLTGDAAHAMTMFRGEAANHGIMDAYHLTEALKQMYRGEMGRGEALEVYEKEMRERTSVAVLWSREACVGAHDYEGLNEQSAVLRRRAIRMPGA